MTGGPEKYAPEEAAGWKAPDSGKVGGALGEMQPSTRALGPEGAYTGETGIIDLQKQNEMADNIGKVAEQTAQGREEAANIEAARDTLSKIEENTAPSLNNQQKAA